MNSLFYQSSLAKKLLTTLIPMALAQSALGIITVHFVETDLDVVVSFNGTISLDPSLTTDTTTTTIPLGGTIQPSTIAARLGSFYQNVSLGVATIPPLTSVEENFPVAGDVGVFGINGNSLAWESVHISGGVIGAVSELSATPANATFTLLGQSLESLNAAGIAENTVLWTATTGDTFVFSANAVPEPSTLFLSALGSLGLLSRRR